MNYTLLTMSREFFDRANFTYSRFFKNRAKSSLPILASTDFIAPLRWWSNTLSANASYFIRLSTLRLDPISRHEIPLRVFYRCRIKSRRSRGDTKSTKIQLSRAVRSGFDPWPCWAFSTSRAPTFRRSLSTFSPQHLLCQGSGELQRENCEYIDTESI